MTYLTEDIIKEFKEQERPTKVKEIIKPLHELEANLVKEDDKKFNVFHGLEVYNMPWYLIIKD